MRDTTEYIAVSSAEEGGINASSNNTITGTEEHEDPEDEENEPDGLMISTICNNNIDDNNHCFPNDDDDDNTDGVSYVTATAMSQQPMIFPDYIDTTYSRYNEIFRRTFFSDDTVKVYNIIFADGPFAIKFFKFTILTFIGIWTMFYFVRFMVSVTIFIGRNVNYIQHTSLTSERLFVTFPIIFLAMGTRRLVTVG
jgi:hypothetical protein